MHGGKGYVTSILFLGMMIGGWVWGNLADAYGRKKMLIWALLVNSLFSATSAFSSSYVIFLFLRFGSGLG